MFIKRTQSGGHTYLQLVESYRNEQGQSRQRTVAMLGRAEQTGGPADALLNGLMRATGRSAGAANPQIEFESALALGDVWALDQLWKELGFDRLAAVFRKARYITPVAHAIRVMVFNRLCDADSKLGVLRWLQTVSMPGVDAALLTHQHLLRSMDALMDHQAGVDEALTALLRPMVDQDLSMVFYDLTTIRAAGLSQQDDDVRQYGMSKEGLIARQFMLGVVQTAEGLPIYHEVFEGNQAESVTLLPTLKTVLARFAHIVRFIVVADRGLLSLDNLEELQKLKLPSGQALEFILAVPGRRYGDFCEILQDCQKRITERLAKTAQNQEVNQDANQAEQDSAQDVVEQTRWNGLSLVVAHSCSAAAEQTQARRTRIAAITAQAGLWSSKLDGQDAGRAGKGRKLSDGGATARMHHAVKQAHLTRIVKVDLKSDLFTYTIDAAAQAQAELMDGKLLLVTNVGDLKPEEIVRRYKALADIERGFRVLKSELEIAPVYHRLPERIRAHALVCFMALIIYGVMRQRLKLAKSKLSPETALAKLRRIQHHSITINAAKPITGVSTITAEQALVLAALNIKKPTTHHQINLL